MAQQHRSPGAEEIDVVIAIRISEVCALGAFNKRGIATNGAKCAYRRIHTTGQDSFRALLQQT